MQLCFISLRNRCESHALQLICSRWFAWKVYYLFIPQARNCGTEQGRYCSRSHCQNWCSWSVTTFITICTSAQCCFYSRSSEWIRTKWYICDNSGIVSDLVLFRTFGHSYATTSCSTIPSSPCCICTSSYAHTCDAIVWTNYRPIYTGLSIKCYLVQSCFQKAAISEFSNEFSENKNCIPCAVC